MLWKPSCSRIRQVISNHGSAPFLWASPFPPLVLTFLLYKTGIIIQETFKLHEGSGYIYLLHCVFLVPRVVTGVRYVFNKHLLKACMDERMKAFLLQRAVVRVK